MRQIEHALPDVPVALAHAQVLQAEHRIAAVENTQHDGFAVNHRNDADAQIDFAARHFQPDAPVLRQALLGDVEMAENLDARNDRRLIFADLRRNVGFDQHAVDAIANAQADLRTARRERRSPATPAPRPAPG